MVVHAFLGEALIGVDMCCQVLVDGFMIDSNAGFTKASGLVVTPCVIQVHRWGTWENGHKSSAFYTTTGGDIYGERRL